MIGFLSRRLDEVTASVEASSRRVAASVALLVAVLLFFLASLAFLSVALYLWVAERTQPLIAALAVAALHIAIALFCLIVFWLKGRRAKPSKQSTNPIPEDPAAASRAEFTENIDETVAPLIAILHEADMKPEEAALRLGVALTKQIGPLALVALALGAGFMFARRLTPPKND
jgi:hypothetical protein